jgi:hypothetical protein
MNRNIPPLSEQRTRAIIDAYGARPAHWPAAERQAALACLAQSHKLQEYCRQQEDLDTRIETALHAAAHDTPAIQALQQRILDALPAQPPLVQRTLYAWINLPRFALAGAGLLTVALLFMLYRTPVPRPPLAVSAYEIWAWYDITGHELPDDTTGTAMTMTDFVELDESPGNS